MKKDVSKYYAAGIFPSETMDKWENFLSSFCSHYGELPVDQPKWFLDDFPTLSARSIGLPIAPVVSEKILKQAQYAKEFRKVNHPIMFKITF